MSAPSTGHFYNSHWPETPQVLSIALRHPPGQVDKAHLLYTPHIFKAR